MGFPILDYCLYFIINPGCVFHDREVYHVDRAFPFKVCDDSPVECPVTDGDDALIREVLLQVMDKVDGTLKESLDGFHAGGKM